MKIGQAVTKRGTHAEGSMIGSLEFCTGKLGSRLILVLGHTKCGAIYGATKTFLDAQQAQEQPKKAGSALEGLLKDLGTVAQQAAEEKGPGASSDEVAAHAVKVNVFHSMNFLLKFSDSIREAVKSGQVQLQGGIYHLETGKVEFLGKSPAQRELLDSTTSIPPSMTAMVKESRGLHGVRTAADERVPSDAALKMLKEHSEGNSGNFGWTVINPEVDMWISQCNRYIFAVGCEEGAYEDCNRRCLNLPPFYSQYSLSII